MSYDDFVVCDSPGESPETCSGARDSKGSVSRVFPEAAAEKPSDGCGVEHSMARCGLDNLPISPSEPSDHILEGAEVFSI